jgi:two-component system, OmpR family, alkaline phosphatase synthesis response regulator PhoP
MAHARVLIVDDHAPGAELVEAYLAELPYETRMANSGEEALKAIGEWKPDVVLLDVMMPRVSGFEVCKQLRSNEATREIGVIMVTALDQHVDIDRAVDVGTDDFITKPINKAELVSRVKALLRAQKMTGTTGKSGPLARTLEYIHSVEENLE